MNSHPFGYESGYNYVAGRGSYNRNMHQGQSNQRWMEPRGSDQPFRRQHPPRYHGQRPFYNAYQDDRYGGPPCSYQQDPPYAHEPSPPQYNFEPPYSQAPFHHSPPYDPNPYPPYQPPYEPNEPHTELPPQYTPSPYHYQDEPPSYHEPFLLTNEPSYPPQTSMEKAFADLNSTIQALATQIRPLNTFNIQPSSSNALPSQPHNDPSIPSPPSMEEHPHPPIQEQDDPNYAIDMEQEREDRLRESILHKELEEALKVKVEETLEGEGVIEGSCHGKVIIKEEQESRDYF